jgi:hypothetical protein
VRLRVLAVVIGVLVLAAVVLAASAKLDTPSQSASVERVIEASRERVWAELVDFGAYEEWNPYVTRASGEAREGEQLDLRLEPPGGDVENVTVKVLTARFERKLRWEDRFLLPGLRDEELTFFVRKLSSSRVRLVADVRLEGLLAPFADIAPTTRGLQQMASALERRAEA